MYKFIKIRHDIIKLAKTVFTFIITENTLAVEPCLSGFLGQYSGVAMVVSGPSRVANEIHPRRQAL